MSEYTELLERQRATLAMQLEAAQAALRDAITSNTTWADEAAALASVVTRQRSEIDMLRAERDQLREVAKATRDTLTVIDEWLGSASTRHAAVDSMRRLERLLSAVGFEYTWKGILDWRSSLIDELWQARFYSGPDGHWHYVPGDPPPVFGNADGPTLAEIVGQLETARGLLMDCWHQLDGDTYVLPGGEVHPGAVGTIHDLHAYLWPEGKTI